MPTTPLPPSDLPVGPPVPDPNARPVPSPRLLTGRSVLLRPLDVERDGQALFEASHGSPEIERLWTYMPLGPFTDARALKDAYGAAMQRGNALFLTVVDRATDRPIGVVAFLAISADHGTIEIGHIWYAPDRQRTAVNTEACFLLLEEAFRLGYRRVEWKCDALNARSRAAALRLGFQFEGVFRQHVIVRGRNRDTAWFSILDTEWPSIREATERWLDWDPETSPRPSLASLIGSM